MVLPDFASSEQVEALKAHALEIVDQFEVDKPSIFSTVNEVRGCIKAGFSDTILATGFTTIALKGSSVVRSDQRQCM